MMKLFTSTGYIAESFFSDLEKQSKRDKTRADDYLQAIAEGIRYNTLLSVARAGTGHLGTSLSMIETLTVIYFRSWGKDDMFILSKGHGAPGLYAVLAAKGYIPVERLDRLRRLGGLAGHCDIETPEIEANTGSLAMGLSKAVGYAIAKKRFRKKGKVVVIVGDAELQEGQCWEAFLSAVSFSCDNLIVIVDDNEVQTDQYTKNIVQYGNLVRAIEQIGFDTNEGSGKTVSSVYKLLRDVQTKNGKPNLVWCHTRKGQGVSYMEHPAVLTDDSKRYVWHNKAPNKEELKKALEEVWGRIKSLLKSEIRNPKSEINPNDKNSKIQNTVSSFADSLSDIPREPTQGNIKGESVMKGFSEGLVELAEKEKNLVVLDADLEEDCGFSLFRRRYPERFFEMGIMEQHMVSAASAMSRGGLVPVFGSYAAFLTSRANEQLYNLATEGARAIIVGNMAGVIPATPGKSHCGFRDIALMKNIPGITMYQPVTSDDAVSALKRYAKGDFGNLLYLRLSMAPGAIALDTPPADLVPGYPQVLRKGRDALIIGIGPVILSEGFLAAEILEKNGVSAEVWNYPWLSRFDDQPLRRAAKRAIPLVIIEDHFSIGGMGESLLAAAQASGAVFSAVRHLALSDFPQTGFRDEMLSRYRLDRHMIVSMVADCLVGKRT